jgi:hypothetical protein
MLNFKLFFEKRVRNPIRKQKLKDMGTMSNLEYIETIKNNLPKEDLKKIKKMEDMGVDADKIETFKSGKLKEYQKGLIDQYTTPKLDKKHKLVMVKHGIEVYKDQYADEDIRKGSQIYYDIEESLDDLVKNYKEILPIKKFKLIITDTQKNPRAKQYKGAPGLFQRYGSPEKPA